MKPLLRQVLITVAIVAALFIFAWTGRIDRTENAGDSPRIALFVNGTLGDKSFFDGAARGLRQARDELGLRVRIVEGGRDPTRWEAAFADLADSGDFDLIIAGSFAMVGVVQRTAGRFPQARFIVFDAAVDPLACRCGNVHSIVFRPREAAFLAGHLAARVVVRERRADPVLGAIGGLPIPVVDDFIDGFIAGARDAEPRLRVLRQYADSFSDPATAKDIAKAMYAQGAGLVFQVAGGSGQGVIEAAAEAGRWVIGVDADQHLLYRDSHPQRAAWILSSVMKHVDVAIVKALREHRAGRLRFGERSSLGLAEGGVSLATSAPAWGKLPAAEVTELAALARRLAADPASIASGDAR
ncbi:BMP family ABC transporter substrate-binding protein [Aquincola sp. S2]|uniref:BMP family ABC transporter substrate-binding protein n=1 Tax=Pseudaquabacterium terrae TaxID=2732868 RepID=A0ABX2EMA2_9BURK|nr:BMP family ABC transporter substrate-binding protein [Aquabacterium terrae]NRF69782.1 BMP family ABC transporter substrate-binding protein [Aquabacterium terrae]